MSGDIPSYQHGNPHRLSAKSDVKEITIDTFPVIKIEKVPPVQPSETQCLTLPHIITRLKYLASLM